ncbi:zinc-ribbon domain containing protein [Thermodesulfobacteriota bacterium]
MPGKEMLCIVCESPFFFKESDQLRYVELGFEEPKRCPECRRRKRRMRSIESSKDRSQRSAENTRHLRLVEEYRT